MEPTSENLGEMNEIVRQINSPETQRILKILTGNTQISKTELEKLIHVKAKKVKRKK